MTRPTRRRSPHRRWNGGTQAIDYDTAMAHLARIMIYPIKSFDGAAVEMVRVLDSGALENDRRFAFVDRAGRFFNAKRTPKIQIPRARFDLAAQTVEMTVNAETNTFEFNAGVETLESWGSQYFAENLQLRENRTSGFPDDTEAPGPTIISTATLQEVARWFPELTIDEVRRRFRANLEIDGVEPFWEDHLYSEAGTLVEFQIGSIRFFGTNPCQRCVVPTRNSTTGERDAEFMSIFERNRRESLPNWASRSRFDHFYRLAVNTRLAGGGGGVLRIGDELRLVD